jgi:hypothetical protein
LPAAAAAAAAALACERWQVQLVCHHPALAAAVLGCTHAHTAGVEHKHGQAHGRRHGSARCLRCPQQHHSHRSAACSSRCPACSCRWGCRTGSARRCSPACALWMTGRGQTRHPAAAGAWCGALGTAAVVRGVTASEQPTTQPTSLTMCVPHCWQRAQGTKVMVLPVSMMAVNRRGGLPMASCA